MKKDVARWMVLLALLASLSLLVACAGGGEEMSDDDDSVTSTETDADTGDSQEASDEFVLTSEAFEDEGAIPVRFADTTVEGGQNVSIPYAWSGAPEGTASFLLLLVDHHPVADEWVHWVVADIPSSVSSLPEGASPDGIPEGARELTNTNGVAGYSGPSPPPGSGDHPYEATLYALDVEHLAVEDGASLEEILSAAEASSLGEASVTGYLGR